MATIQYSSADGTVAINRLYCAVENPTTVEALEEICSALYDVWVAQIMPRTSTQWFLSGIRARDMAVAEGLQFISEETFPVSGTVSDGEGMGNQVSYTVTLQSGLVGRSARGRIYGVGLPISYQNGVRVTDAAHALLQPAWNLVQSAMETAGHALQIVSFFDEGVPRAAGRPLPVVSMNVRFPLATQRRRLT